MVELDMDEYGCVDADDSHFPISVVEHDWGTPYPPVAEVFRFAWEPGSAKRKPDVFWYPQMRDWVCSKRAYEVLVRSAGFDIHKIADGMLDGEPVVLVQAPNVLDVVDRNKSIIDKYETYEALRFPAFKVSEADGIASRVFRVPGDITMVFVGDVIKDALEDAGVEGFRFLFVDWAES